MTTVKDEALRLIAQLPDDVTWDHLLRRLFVRSHFNAVREATSPANAEEILAHALRLLHRDWSPARASQEAARRIRLVPDDNGPDRNSPR
jgi:hypothetical protein